jgi:acyl-CoA reductase-like NAD-dependent aldehyde dehydrogenase
MIMTMQCKHYINGHWETGVSKKVTENPSDASDPVGEFACADARLTEDAIRAAAAARASWADSTPQRRFDVLDFVGSEILARKDEFGRLLAREEGKTLPEAIGEATRAGMIFKYFAGEALRQRGDLLASVRPGVQIEVSREPVGVIGLIAPWNFPLAIPAWKIAPALAFGNTVVFKPAELVPACGWQLAEVISRAGLPAGVFNLVLGPGRLVGQTMVDSPSIDALSFTGSVPTGQRILKAAAARGLKVQLEMGGKNPLVVLADADLARAVDCAVQGAFFSTGQRCTASSRLIVEAAIFDRFVEALHKRTAALRVGHALDRETEIGPVVSADQLEKDLSYVDIGCAEGGRLLVGGRRVELPHAGHYMSPALMLAEPHHRIACEEIFGPVACVIRADDYEHALALANDTPFGLCAGICTTSLQRSAHFKRHAAAGMVMVNLPTAGVDYHVPFGGRKGSSYGPREQGGYAKEFYTTVKTTYISA